jgi:hypothetical protein
MEEKQSWITEVYQEFWDKANELAEKEYKNDSNLDLKSRAERRDLHLSAMVAMFIALMSADEEDADCGGDEDEGCDGCDQLPDCRERWTKEARKN